MCSMRATHDFLTTYNATVHGSVAGLAYRFDRRDSIVAESFAVGVSRNARGANPFSTVGDCCWVAECAAWSPKQNHPIERLGAKVEEAAVEHHAEAGDKEERREELHDDLRNVDGKRHAAVAGGEEIDDAGEERVEETAANVLTTLK